MKKSEFISKQEHRITIKNYCKNLLKSYFNGLFSEFNPFSICYRRNRDLFCANYFV